MRLRAAPVDPSTLPADLGVDWSQWSDGKAYRLKKKKDFPNVNPGLARTACEQAAIEMGKVARTVRDKMIPEKLIWVQFADAEIHEGEPCPRCGSRRILRLHGGFGRCPQCKAQLLLADPIPQDDAEEGAAQAEPDDAKQRQKFIDRLHGLTRVHLDLQRQTTETDYYNGYGEQEGLPVFVIAEFDHVPDQELASDNFPERLTWLGTVPASRLEGLVDWHDLAARPESDWDLVLN